MNSSPLTHPSSPTTPHHHQSPGTTAREWLTLAPLFLDTETTGISGTSEICEIAIIDHHNNVLLNTLVKPSKPIGSDVIRIHGISNEMVANAPPFTSLTTTLSRILHHRHLIAYNASFDQRLLTQSAHLNEVALGLSVHWHCAMGLFKAFCTSRGILPDSSPRLSLTAAAGKQGIDTSTTLHRALADADLTRRLVLNIAQY